MRGRAPVTAEIVLLALTLLAGSALQSGLGFGFAIVAAPVMAAVAGPATVAPTLAVVGVATNTLLLFGERRRRQVLVPTAVRLVAWALPGLAVGAAILATIAPRPLSVLVALAVLVAVALQAAASRHGDAALGGAVAARDGAVRPPGSVAGAEAARRRSLGRRGPDRDRTDGAVAGFASGVLSGSVGLNGPPLVLHLLARGATPMQLRDTLAVVFLASSAVALVLFALAGTLRLAPAAPLLVGAAVVGWALGRLALDPLQRVHRPVSLAVLAFGAVVALAQALL